MFVDEVLASLKAVCERHDVGCVELDSAQVYEGVVDEWKQGGDNWWRAVQLGPTPVLLLGGDADPRTYVFILPTEDQRADPRYLRQLVDEALDESA